MAINSDNTRMTLDFEYEDGKVCMKVRFHHTPQYGPTISVSDDGTRYLGYPAKLFVEISDFIKSQNLLRGTFSSTTDSAEGATVEFDKTNVNSSELPAPSVIEQPVSERNNFANLGDSFQSFGEESSEEVEMDTTAEAQFLEERKKALEKAKDNKKKLRSNHKTEEDS